MEKYKPSSSSDADIIDRVLDGNTDAFESLLIKYKSVVFSIVGRHVPVDQVEDVAQDVFVRVYQSLRKLKKADSFKAWLSAITLRTCYDFWRKGYRLKETPFGKLSLEQKDWLERSLATSSEDEWQSRGKEKEAGEILDLLLSTLNPAERMVINLVYVEGLSTRETAHMLGWSEVNVKVRAFRIRQKLKRFFLSIERTK